MTGAGITHFLVALEPTRLNGATFVARFKACEIDDASSWFVTSTNAYSYETFRTLFTSEAAASALPEVLAEAAFPYGAPPNFYLEASGALRLDGELAAMLSQGGAYVRFAGTDAEAKRIAGAAARDLLQDRYEDFRVYASQDSWTPWFCDVAWDATWVLVDDANLEVTVMVSTDTD